MSYSYNRIRGTLPLLGGLFAVILVAAFALVQMIEIWRCDTSTTKLKVIYGAFRRSPEPKNLHDVRNLVGMLRFCLRTNGHWYPTRAAFRDALEPERTRSITNLVQKLERFTGKDFQDDPDAWESWLRLQGAQ